MSNCKYLEVIDCPIVHSFTGSLRLWSGFGRWLQPGSYGLDNIPSDVLIGGIDIRDGGAVRCRYPE